MQREVTEYEVVKGALIDWIGSMALVIVGIPLAFWLMR